MATEAERFGEDLELRYRGGNLIKHPHLAVTRFINTGNRPITPQDFIEPITIDVHASKVLSAEVTSTSQDEIEPSLSWTTEQVELRPTLLNPGDWVTVGILSDSEPEQLQPHARVVGVKRLRPYDEERKKKGRRGQLMAVILALILGGVGFSIGAFLIPPGPRLSEIDYAIRNVALASCSEVTDLLPDNRTGVRYRSSAVNPRSLTTTPILTREGNTAGYLELRGSERCRLVWAAIKYGPEANRALPIYFGLKRPADGTEVHIRISDLGKLQAQNTALSTDTGCVYAEAFLGDKDDRTNVARTSCAQP